MKRKNSTKSTIYMIFLMVFFYAPIIFAVFFSFNSSASLTTFKGFSLKWYDTLFHKREMMESIGYTMLIAFVATVVSTVVGTITAIGLSKCGKVYRTAVEQVNNLPMMNPDIVTAVGLLMLFAGLHVDKSLTTVILAHIMFCTPYVIVSVLPRMRGLDPSLFEAALDLGATPVYALVKIIIPQIMPGVISGALISFTMSFDDFVITYFVTGEGVSNISTYVYTMAKRVNPSINALATIVILIISAILVILNWLPGAVSKSKED